MEAGEARTVVVCRARDFGNWANHPVGVNPYSPGQEKETPEYVLACAIFVRANLPQIVQSDPGAWKPGGWKREELDQAFSVLGLVPLE